MLLLTVKFQIMRVVAYSVKSFEKEPLAIANRKKHEITLISNPLTVETASFALGKDAVVISIEDALDAQVIDTLADLGVRFIATRSTSSDHIDVQASGRRQIKIASVPAQLTDQALKTDYVTIFANQTILNLDRFQSKGCLAEACVCARACKKTSDDAVKTNHGLL